MASISNRNLKRAASEALLNEIQSRTTRLYYYVGKTLPFEGSDSIPVATQEYEAKVRSEMIALKEIKATDVSFVVPRINWETDTEYEQYDVRTTGPVPYVFNEENFSLYVCTKRGSGFSTVKPTHTSVYPVLEVDGYEWVYVLTVPASDREKFLTTTLIPVNNALNNQFFSDGGIEQVIIKNAGDGYTQEGTTISLAPESYKLSGSGAKLTPQIVGGKLVRVSIDRPGSGYVNPLITVNDKNATVQAVVEAVIGTGDIRSAQAAAQSLSEPGYLTSCVVVSGGSGYTNATTIQVVGDGTGATVSFTKHPSTGAIETITVVNRGSGYTKASLVVSDVELTGGSGFEGYINIAPLLGFGRDVLSTLGATDLMIYANLARESIDGVQIDNDFRRFGIIKNPRTLSNNSYPIHRYSSTTFGFPVAMADVSKYPVGTKVYSEFPTTVSTQSFTVLEVVMNNSEAIVVVSSDLAGNAVIPGQRYYKNSTDYLISDSDKAFQLITKRLASGCYVLNTSAPDLFDINTFVPDTVLTKNGKRFVVVSCTPEKMVVNSIDGASVVAFEGLSYDATTNVVAKTVTEPAFDKRTGEVLTIDNREPFRQNDQQSISFRTIIRL